MMPGPHVSVLIAVRDGERYLPSAIASLQQQDFRPLEIIVVDGKSTDKTAAIAQAIPGARYLYQRDDGLAAARNLALQESKGDLIAFLDADDVWLPGKLAAQADYLGTHPQTSGVLTRLRFVLEPEYLASVGATPARYRKDVVGYTPSALLARREVFFAVGTFDTAYALGSDADWFARLMESGLAIAVLPQPLVNKRIHGGNISLNVARARAETLHVLQRSIRRRRTD